QRVAPAVSRLGGSTAIEVGKMRPDTVGAFWMGNGLQVAPAPRLALSVRWVVPSNRLTQMVLASLGARLRPVMGDGNVCIALKVLPVLVLRNSVRPEGLNAATLLAYTFTPVASVSRTPRQAVPLQSARVRFTPTVAAAMNPSHVLPPSEVRAKVPLSMA